MSIKLNHYLITIFKFLKVEFVILFIFVLAV